MCLHVCSMIWLYNLHLFREAVLALQLLSKVSQITYLRYSHKATSLVKLNTNRRACLLWYVDICLPYESVKEVHTTSTKWFPALRLLSIQSHLPCSRCSCKVACILLPRTLPPLSCQSRTRGGLGTRLMCMYVAALACVAVCFNTRGQEWVWLGMWLAPGLYEYVTWSFMAFMPIFTMNAFALCFVELALCKCYIHWLLPYPLELSLWPACFRSLQ